MRLSRTIKSGICRCRAGATPFIPRATQSQALHPLGGCIRQPNIESRVDPPHNRQRIRHQFGIFHVDKLSCHVGMGISKLENPALVRTAQLQMLEKALLPAIRRTEVRPVQKRLVCRDMTDRDEFFGQKCITMDRHALMRRPRAHRVNRIHSRSEPAEPPQEASAFRTRGSTLFGDLLAVGMGNITSQTRRIESAGSIGGSPKSSSSVPRHASVRSDSLWSNHSRRLRRSPKVLHPAASLCSSQISARVLKVNSDCDLRSMQ